ncbi:hypothetical protein B9Z55_003372 [Caenorhabditis nigoni]|uniref:DUF7154 domain-containing protein n=1 Tax=Caenorhabditis nigoni TaxID=1611254 RepID=A0A2G5VQ06_9PELO|nr:hypothetical protein B9Z55_003372 [Caenorhabditis nigoni]
MDLEFHSNKNDVNSTIAKHLPDPNQGFRNSSIGSNIFDVIENFLSNTQAPVCGSTILILLKRYPNESDISRLVSLIRSHHAIVHVMTSATPSGGSQPKTMYSVTSNTNGMGAFEYDENFSSAISRFPAFGNLSPVYATTIRVSGSGSKTLPGFYPSITADYVVEVTYQDHVLDDSFQNLTLRWTSSQDSGNFAIDSNDFLPGGTLKFTWQDFYGANYNMALDYNYSGQDVQNLQIRIYSQTDVNSTILDSLPNPNQGFQNSSIGSNVFDAIEKFFSNTQAPVCASRIVILLKRYPNEADTTRLVSLIRSHHAIVHVVTSGTPSGGSQPKTMYSVASKTNGMGAFEYDDKFTDINGTYIFQVFAFITVDYKMTLDYDYLGQDGQSLQIRIYSSENVISTITNNLPNPNQGFHDSSIGSNVFDIIEKFFSNTQAPVCGSFIVILLKRYPNEMDISRLVSLIRSHHAIVHVITSATPSGGSQSKTMHSVASKTNGMGAFEYDEHFKDIIGDFPIYEVIYPVYATTTRVSGSGTKILPDFYPSVLSSYIYDYISITYQDHDDIFCKAGNFPPTFLLAYSNDFSAKTVWDTWNAFSWAFVYVPWFGSVRFDTPNIVIHFDKNIEDVNSTILNNLPDPNQGFQNSSIGSNVFDVIEKFFSNTEAPVCGSIIYILLKRYPNEANLSRLVSLIRSHHAIVHVMTSATPSGGSQPKTMYSVASKTNGVEAFEYDEYFQYFGGTYTFVFDNFYGINYNMTLDYNYSGHDVQDLQIRIYNDTSCSPSTYPQTFLFAYSNDLSSKTVLDTWDEFSGYKNLNYSWYGSVRIDIENVDMEFHSKLKDVEPTILNNLPNPIQGFQNSSIGSNVFDVIEKFFSNTEAPVCGSIIFILLKRYPNESDVSRFVSLIRSHHATLHVMTSGFPSGGSQSKAMYSVASKTNGMGAFEYDENFKSFIAYFPIYDFTYPVYATTTQVSGNGTKTLPDFYPSIGDRYWIAINYQDHVPIDSFQSLNLSWTNPEDSGNFTVYSSEAWGNGTYKYNKFHFYNVDYKVILDYNYLDQDVQNLQIRAYSQTPLNNWLPYSD